VRVHVSLASWPGQQFQNALLHAKLWGVNEPLFGNLSLQHIQLVPQSQGVVTEDAAEELVRAWPGVQFRLHANVRVFERHRLADLSNFDRHQDYFAQLARVSQALQARVYTAHAGRRCFASMPTMLQNARRAADLFGCSVGVEGLYPAPGDPWLVSTWDEYQELYESGVPYALDLSHLHILATHTERRELSLLQEMLSCPRCIEVHVSHNDGRSDRHQVCSDPPPWWFELLASINPDAVVFSEGNQHQQAQGTQP
jgi:hypothetical protein